MAQNAPQPTASHLAAARDVAAASGMTRSFDAMTEPFLDQLQQMNVTRPEIKKDLDEVTAMLRPEIEMQKEKMLDNVARVFALQLTEPELKEIAAFYKTPTGVKYVNVQPGLLDDIVKDLADLDPERLRIRDHPRPRGNEQARPPAAVTGACRVGRTAVRRANAASHSTGRPISGCRFLRLQRIR